MGIYSNDFCETFAALLQKTGVTCYQISQYTRLNQAYLSRLKTGEKHNPSPETVIKIGLAFTCFSNKVRLYDIHRLFKSVGRSLNLADEF